MRLIALRATRLALVVAFVVSLGGFPTVLHAQGDALTLREVLDLRGRGVSSRQILRNAQAYCVAFTVTDSVERALRGAGADTLLLNGIRQSCVAMSPSVQLAPGVLLDDTFTAMSGLRTFTAADRLCTARPDGRGLRVENRRLALGCAIEYPLELGDTTIRVELTVAQVEGKRDALATLGFGKDRHSWDQYSFSLTSDHRLELCASGAGRCRQLLLQQQLATVRPDPATASSTRIAVELRGREVALYVDDRRVGSYTAAKPVVGSISLGVGPRSAAIFSRLRVERLDGRSSSR